MARTLKSYMESVVVEIVRLGDTSLTQAQVRELRSLLEGESSRCVTITQQNIREAFQNTMANLGRNKVDSSVGVLTAGWRNNAIATESAKKIIDASDPTGKRSWNQMFLGIKEMLMHLAVMLSAEGRDVLKTDNEKSFPQPPLHSSLLPHVNVFFSRGDLPQA